MREYVTPRMTGETFAANEYIAACWGVACQTSWANDYERWQGDDRNGVTHDAEHCGNSSNQVIKVDKDNNPITMIETGTDGLGNLTCIIYWGSDLGSDYSQIRDISTVGIGDTIYWTTTASDGRTWNHKGTVFATAEGHPNRS